MFVKDFIDFSKFFPSFSSQIFQRYGKDLPIKKQVLTGK